MATTANADNVVFAVDEQQQQQQQQQDEYIRTVSQCYVSRHATMNCPTKVELRGRSVIETGCLLDAKERASIRIGRYCIIGKNTQLLLPERTDHHHPSKYVPMTIGSNVIIGRDCILNTAAVGSYCSIGDNVRLGKRVIIKDCCVIDNNVVLGDDTIVPPFTRLSSSSSVSNNTAAADDDDDDDNDDTTNASTTATTEVYRWCIPQCMELPPSTSAIMQERTIEMYQNFDSIQQQQQQQSSKQQQQA